MDDVDQHGFSHPRSPEAAEAGGYLDGAAAAALLGVKRETLYAYASRGLVRGVASGRGHARLYARADLERLRVRRDARSGHAPVAAAALRWGEPVLESAITAIGARGPVYRGHAAVDLAEAGVPFEAVAELLWTGALPGAAALPDETWLHAPAIARAELRRLVPAGAHVLTALAIAVPAHAARDVTRFQAPLADELARARALVLRLAGWLGLGQGSRRPAARPAARWDRRESRRARKRAGAPRPVARRLLEALGGDGRERAVLAIDRALVLCADHELNPSSFAARVTAATGADLYACVASALATLSGPRHGGACDRVEALVDEVAAPARARAVLLERRRRGEEVAGFGHPLYPGGDPRAAPLLEAAAALAPRSPRVRTALALASAMRGLGQEAPTIDLGLCALAGALGLPRGAAAGLFAVGRAAGWIAHALEQRAQGFLVRPRARYVGVAPVER